MTIGIVTGASSGMGRDFVKAIDREFVLDEIWVVARREERLRELQNDVKTKLRPVVCDLSVKEEISRIKGLLEDVQPEIRILVNAAGYGLFGEFAAMDTEDQAGIIDVNDRALTMLCGMALPYMKEGSKIVNMGSNSSWQPVPYIAVYGASKAYVLSFSRALGRELKTRKIQVMCVCPGWIKTEFMDRAVHDDTIRYYDRWYTSEQVVKKAMKDLKKGKKVSVLGFPVRSQVRMVRLLPTETTMNIWCRQQGKK